MEKFPSLSVNNFYWSEIFMYPIFFMLNSTYCDYIWECYSTNYELNFVFLLYSNQYGICCTVFANA